METLTGYHIPNDMIINILARLPVKSLIRFKTVSKSWLSLISNPSFVNFYLRPAITSFANSESLLVHRIKDKYCNSISLVSQGDFTNEISNYFEDISEECKLYVVGSYNGIVCVVNVNTWCDCGVNSPHPNFRFRRPLTESELYIYLWNPVTKQSKLLPPVNPDSKTAHCYTYFSYLSDIVSVGFGFDPIANDFKVVRTHDVFPNKRTSGMVYSANMNVWKEIEPRTTIINPHHALCDVCVKGVLYWTSDFGVIRFDLNNGVFYNDRFPANVQWTQKTSQRDVRITEINDSIAAIMFFYENDEADGRVNLWTVVDRSEGPWILKCSFVVAPTVDWVHGYLNSSQDILYRTKNGEWWLYNPNENKKKNAPVPVGTRKILKHTESLISIRGSEQLCEMLTRTRMKEIDIPIRKAKFDIIRTCLGPRGLDKLNNHVCVKDL